MWQRCCRNDWKVMLDYTFIRNCIPELTPAKFRRKHTKDFLHMLHPELVLSDDDVDCMHRSSGVVFIEKASYKTRLDQYYAESGVSLHHVLIATQDICVKCGSTSKYTCDLHAVRIYTRCTNSNCRHRGNYGWDVFCKPGSETRLFQQLKDRHCMPYWVCSNQTAFVTSMIRDEMLSQVLWNHAGSLTMANQGNWLLGHFDKLLH